MVKVGVYFYFSFIEEFRKVGEKEMGYVFVGVFSIYYEKEKIEKIEKWV